MVALPASAQAVHKADRTKVQVMVARNANGFKHCGIRFVFAQSASQTTDLYDMQMVAIADDFAGDMLTGNKITLTNEELIALKGQAMPTPGPSPVGVWIAKSTDAKPLIPFKIVPDETGMRMLISFTRFDLTVQQILNMAEGATMQLMLSYPGQGERVIQLMAPLEQDDIETLKACLKDVTKRGFAFQDQQKKPAAK